MWIVEFYHAYFGWLDYEREFANKQAAQDWINSNPSPYKRRIVQVS